MARVKTGSMYGAIKKGEVIDIEPANQAFTICTFCVIAAVHVLAIEVISMETMVHKDKGAEVLDGRTLLIWSKGACRS